MEPIGSGLALGQADLHLAQLDADPVAQRLRRGLRAGAGHQLLDRALQVVALEARAALAEVELDDGAVGLVELVVDEIDDALDVVDTVVAAVLVRAHDPLTPSTLELVCSGSDAAGSRSLART